MGMPVRPYGVYDKDSQCTGYAERMTLRKTK